MSDISLSLDQLAIIFQSVSIHDTDTYVEECNSGYTTDNEYSSGYTDGYEEGYAKAISDIHTQKSCITKTYKPSFGWKVVNNQLIQDPQEQCVIHAIKCLLRDFPGISLSDICRSLTHYGFHIRKSARIYPAMIRNIIIANNL